jgi:hypothetical protein
VVKIAPILCFSLQLSNEAEYKYYRVYGATSIYKIESIIKFNQNQVNGSGVHPKITEERGGKLNLIWMHVTHL